MTNDIIKKENIVLKAVEPELGNAIINWGEGQISLTKVLRKLGKKRKRFTSSQECKFYLLQGLLGRVENARGSIIWR